MNKALYVRHIPAEATEEDLRKLFSVCGKVTYIHMVKDAKSGEFVGCAFVKMATEAEAKDAIAMLDEALLINRTILVSAARPQKAKGSPSTRSQRQARPTDRKPSPAKPSGKGPRTGRPSGKGSRKP
jgi:RNA recognition motif-containing protein